MGVLPDHTIKQLIDGGRIKGITPKYINPGSLDLPVSSEAYRLEKIFVPQEGETIDELLPWAGATKHDLATPLEVGVSYLVLVDTYIELPAHLYAYANPKSTSGRLNLFVRLIADGMDKYDTLKRGWRGKLWLLVQPRSFPVLLSPGIALSQVRFFEGKSFLDQTQLVLADDKRGLFFDRGGNRLPLSGKREHADSLYLSIRADGGQVGWECAGSNKVLDLSKIKHYKPEEFSFRPVVAKDGEIVLLQGVFYILTTEESVLVPPECSAELRATEPRVGEFRAHFAGFIDAGWGYGDASHGQPITLEVTTTERQLSLRHMQTIARIRYERMREVPTELYGVRSHYVGQMTAQLSKHFADP